MASNSIDNLFGAYLDPRSVGLGRLFTEVKFPSNNFLEPPAGISIQQTETVTTDAAFAASSNFSGNLTTSLSSLFGLDLTHSNMGNFTISFNKLDVIHLQQHRNTSDALFEAAEVRNWVQDQWRRNDHVYMLTGYMVATGIHRGSNGTITTTANATATIAANQLPGTAAAAVANLAIGNPAALSAAVKGGIQDNNTGSLVLDVINPTVVAAAYKEVHLAAWSASWADHVEAKTRSIGYFGKDDFSLGAEMMSLYLSTRG